MQVKKKNIKGSGIIVVIFASLAASVYMISAFADYEHLARMQNNYSNKLKSIYTKRVESVDNYYEVLEDKIDKNENYILE